MLNYNRVLRITDPSETQTEFEDPFDDPEFVEWLEIDFDDTGEYKTTDDPEDW